MAPLVIWASPDFSDNDPANKGGWITQYCYVTGQDIQNHKILNPDAFEIFFGQDIIGRRRCLLLCRSAEYNDDENHWLFISSVFQVILYFQRFSSDCLSAPLLLLVFSHPPLGILFCRWRFPQLKLRKLNYNFSNLFFELSFAGENCLHCVFVCACVRVCVCVYCWGISTYLIFVTTITN